MEQLVQQLKDGRMELLQVPYPQVDPRHVLVRTHYSLISIGTERNTVKDARAGYIAKARARQDEVKKVVKAAKTYGIKNTYDLVMNKLESPSSLGYSCAGTVIGIGSEVRGIQIGDKVACGGASAVHAEVVSVPVNLVAKVGEHTPMKHAAFTTVGAIAMQGVRRADLKLGESCVIIGLGLLGLLTAQLLQASGVEVIGIDLDPSKIALAKKIGIKHSFLRSDLALEQEVNSLSNGNGVDATIITAGSSSNDPVNLAGQLCRKKGKVVIVGSVSTDFKRKAFYRKELDLIMSCSYGPGRYDAEYEQKGLDYPIAYVRWTEQRNMQSFLDLMDRGKLDLEPLVSKVIDFAEAPSAYDMIMKSTEGLTGVLLRYDLQKSPKRNIRIRDVRHADKFLPCVGWVGAGSFASNFLLPSISSAVELHSVCNSRPNSSRNMADRYGFANCVSDAVDMISEPRINTVMITSRHDSHGPLVLESLKQGKDVFVEKPLCLSRAMLEEIKEEYSKGKSRVMVGFNRRFAPMTVQLKEFIGAAPMSITYRINSGMLPPDHWVNDKDTGGGRIVGEAVHFIDLCSFIAESQVISVAAVGLKDAHGLINTVSINLGFMNGSIATISYMSNGGPSLAKERLEVFSNGKMAVIDDFKILELHGAKVQRIKGKQDKGHAHEMTAFFHALSHGDSLPISFEESYESTKTTFMVLDSIKENGMCQYHDT